jgi:hypothetical protein
VPVAAETANVVGVMLPGEIGSEKVATMTVPRFTPVAVSCGETETTVMGVAALQPPCPRVHGEAPPAFVAPVWLVSPALPTSRNSLSRPPQLLTGSADRRAIETRAERSGTFITGKPSGATSS